MRTQASHCCDRVQVAWDVHLKALESFTVTYGSVRVSFFTEGSTAGITVENPQVLQKNTHSVGRSHDQLNASSLLGHSRTRVHIFSAEISRILLRAISSCGVFLQDIYTQPPRCREAVHDGRYRRVRLCMKTWSTGCNKHRTIKTPRHR